MKKNFGRTRTFFIKNDVPKTNKKESVSTICFVSHKHKYLKSWASGYNFLKLGENESFCVIMA